MVSAEAALALWAAAPPEIPADVRALGLVGLTDCLGVAVGGLRAPVTAIAHCVSPPLSRLLLREGVVCPTISYKNALISDLPSRAWVSDDRRAAPDTAWLLGIAAHALDFDDYMHPLHGHVSSVVLPAIWAVAEPLGVSGADLLIAYAVGYQVDWAVSQVLGTPHYERGWHATSTAGVLGAVAAVGWLRKLNAEQMSNALAIGASSAAGLRVNFGTNTKALHVGAAARAAVVACALAESGATGASDWLVGPHGMLAVMGGAASAGDAPALVTAGLAEWGLLRETGLMLKPYPCCGSSHATITAALDARREFPGPWTDVIVTVDPLVSGILRHHRPVTPDQARYSLEYPVAVALLDGEVGAGQFTPERVAAPDVADLLPRIHVNASRTNDEDERFAASVTLRANGREVTREVRDAPGHPRQPLTAQERESKFVRCAGDVLGTERAQSLWTTAQQLEALPDVSDWPELLDPI